MYKKNNIITEISNMLAVLQCSIENHGIIGLQDIKVASENFFAGLLNIIYDLQLINVNSKKPNFPAIDLVDEQNGICFQITSENRSEKIKEVKEKYHTYGLNVQYPNLKIFIFNKKPKGREPDKQVMYKDDLLNEIQILEIDKLTEIQKYLTDNIKIESFRQTKKALEFKSIENIIKYLSAEPPKKSEDVNYESKPHPEEKLELRFKEYKEAITSEWAELNGEYDALLKEAKKQFIDDGNSNKIKCYLKRTSREILIEEKNNGKNALNRLMSELQQKLDSEVNEGAIRYYLLSELIECDLFTLTSGELKN